MQRVVNGGDLVVVARLVVRCRDLLDRRQRRLVGDENLSPRQSRQQPLVGVGFLARPLGVFHRLRGLQVVPHPFEAVGEGVAQDQQMIGGEVEGHSPLAARRVLLDRSLNAALGYLQREACWTRRGADAEFVRGSGFLAAGYRHRSSRNGDPQVHVHALVANATQGPDDKWTRLYHPAIYEHAKTAGYIFEAQFRQELTQSLGARWREVRNGIAEIGGFDDAHLRAFSTRRAEIIEAAGPGASARSRQIANLTTREAKEQGIGSADLRRRWHEQAEGIGLDLSTVWIGERTPDRPVLTAEQLDLAVTEGVSHFDRRDVIQAVAGLLQHGGEATEIERTADAFLASDAVLPISEGTKEPRYTTRRIWELEHKALATAERMRSQGVPPAGELIAARVIRSRPTLKADQCEMVAACFPVPRE